VRSTTFAQAVDKQIADLLLDDEMLAQAHTEIEQGQQALGDFTAVAPADEQ
jgi:hypothetical protein